MSKNNKHVLIIANGQEPKKPLLEKLVSETDIIIAADGGSNICFQNSIYPDFIIGDLDSINPEVKIHFHDSEIIPRPDQNSSDLEKALEFSKSLNPLQVCVTAVFGKRSDHSMANLFALQDFAKYFPLEFYDDAGKMSVISKNNKLNLAKNTIISLFSFKPVFGVTLAGFEFNLQNKDFPHGFNGLSNKILFPPAMVQIKSGSLILYQLYANH